jgi:hypothetical protein
MNELDLSLEQYDLWRSITKNQQLEMATNLLEDMRSVIPDMPKDVDAMTLLDALGCAGLSLIVGEYASLTFIENLNEVKP